MVTTETVWRQSITVLAALLANNIESIADFNTFDRVDAHQRVGNICIQTVKYRFT